jgi:hypothetical protein
MAPPRFVPSDSILEKWRAQGMTVADMVARIKADSGVEVAPGTVYAALSRAGLTEQIRYDDFIPWSPIRADHSGAYPLVMLRLAARREAGQQLPPEREAKLDRWIARMKEQGVVIHYEHDTADGWFYVPARPGIDTGLIRVTQ